MEITRHEALRLLRLNLDSDNPHSFEDMHVLDADSFSQEKENELITVSLLIHFWEMTSQLIQSEYVDGKTAKVLLKHYFEKHYQHSIHQFWILCQKDSEPYQLWRRAIQELADLWEVSR